MAKRATRREMEKRLDEVFDLLTKEMWTRRTTDRLAEKWGVHRSRVQALKSEALELMRQGEELGERDPEQLRGWYQARLWKLWTMALKEGKPADALKVLMAQATLDKIDLRGRGYYGSGMEEDKSQAPPENVQMGWMAPTRGGH